MKNIFKQLIVDFQESEIPKAMPREFDIITLPENVRKAIIYTGIRRCGKTWFLYDIMHRLMSNGLNKQRILYINFTDDRLEGLSSQELKFILEAYFELNPGLIADEEIYFFFDEIHEIEGFDKFIRRLLDNEKMQIYITGSSSKMLSKEISTLLRGRTIIQEIFPFNFFEYLRNKHIEIETPYSSSTRQKLYNQMQDYITIGGFPEVLHMDKRQRFEVLQGYVNSVVYQDIIERYQIKNVQVVKAAIHHCIKNAATKLSVNKLYSRFKSLGYALTKDALYEYLGYFEDSYCIFSIPLFTPSMDKQQNNPKKIYPVDTGLISAYSFSKTIDMAAKLETLVFITLRKQFTNIFYYLTHNGLETDFVAYNYEAELTLVQACVDLDDEATQNREVAALILSMQELKVSTAYIVTIDTHKTINIDNKVIEIIPILDFLTNYQMLLPLIK